MDKIKVLRLRSTQLVFGPGKSILTFASKTKLADVIIATFIYAGQQKSAFIKETEKLGLKTENIYMRFSFDPLAIFRLLRLIKEKKIEIVHTHGYKEDIIGFFAAKMAGIKKVAMVHGWTGQSSKEKVYKFLDKLILRYFDKIITVGGSLKTELIRMAIPERKIEVIHNAIDIDKYSQDSDGKDIKSEFGIGKDEKLVGTICRLNIEKGHKYFLESATELLKTHNNVRFMIVGEGKERKALEQLSQTLGINKKVIFTGHRRDIESFFSAFNVFVLPSLYEGLPNVILEAFALKKPVVATNVGDVAELIKHKETGFLVEPKDSKALAQGIAFFLENEKEAEKFACNGYQLVRNKFSADKRIEKIEEIYLSLFNGIS